MTLSVCEPLANSRDFEGLASLIIHIDEAYYTYGTSMCIIKYSLDSINL